MKKAKKKPEKYTPFTDLETENLGLKYELKVLGEAFTKYRESVGVTGEAKSEYEQKILRLEVEKDDLMNKLRHASAYDRSSYLKEIHQLKISVDALEIELKNERSKSYDYGRQLDIYRKLYNELIEKVVNR